MRLLLDTHVWLWMLAAPGRLGEAEQQVLDTDNELYLSAASVWEIGIKHSIGRLHLPEPPAEFVPRRLETTGVKPIPITVQDTLEVAALPMHHRDPFDRLLVSQAVARGLVLITADTRFSRYGVDLLMLR